MKLSKFLFVMIILLLFISGCSNSKSLYNNIFNDSIHISNEYKTITPPEAKERLEKEKDIILLDVRTEEEHKVKHIPNSILAPVENLENEIKDKINEKDVTIFVYCRSGRRSNLAVEILNKLGYTNVFDLGGISSWPYETESN